MKQHRFRLAEADAAWLARLGLPTHTPHTVLVLALETDERGAVRIASADAGTLVRIEPLEGSSVLATVLGDAGPVFRPRPAPARHGLTKRELCRGATNAAIARALFLSPNTVKGRVRRVSRTLRVRNRAAAVGEAHRGGLVR